MLNHPIFELIKDKLKGSHDPTHVERVLQYAKKINQIRRGNWKIIETAIILHEITKNNPESSREYLKDYTDEEIEKIIYCIKKHHDFIDKPDNLEAKIVQDADILDMLGAIGIARAFIASGEKDLNLIDAKNEYKKKRLALLANINLDETKNIADKKYAFTKLFFDTIEEELEELK